jgi:hypothetical protein
MWNALLVCYNTMKVTSQNRGLPKANSDWAGREISCLLWNLKVHYNIQSASLSDWNSVCISYISMSCLSHFNNTWWRVQFMKLLTMQSSTISCYFLPLILLSTLLSDIFNLCYSFNVEHQVSDPYKTKEYYSFSYLILRWSDSRQEENHSKANCSNHSTNCISYVCRTKWQDDYERWTGSCCGLF